MAAAASWSTNAAATPCRGYSLILDGDAAGYTAISHLLEHGHRRIGLVTAPLIWPNVAEIYEGYRRAIHPRDLPHARRIELCGCDHAGGDDAGHGDI